MQRGPGTSLQRAEHTLVTPAGHCKGYCMQTGSSLSDGSDCCGSCLFVACAHLLLPTSVVPETLSSRTLSPPERPVRCVVCTRMPQPALACTCRLTQLCRACTCLVFPCPAHLSCPCPCPVCSCLHICPAPALALSVLVLHICPAHLSCTCLCPICPVCPVCPV